MTSQNLDYDIVVVGAGVSGLYSAWKLKQANPRWRIVVLEGSGRVGGRLLSVRPPGISNMVAELGGMRILPAVQPRITRLIEELNRQLPEDPIQTYDFPVDEPQNIAYLRGTHLRLSDFTRNPDKVPYHLNFLERGNTSGAILVNAIEQIVPGITNPNLDEEARRRMAQSASFDGKPLYKWGFWNVLMRIISGEAYQFSVDTGGYETTVSNWNAADAIPWFLADFGVAPKYKGFTKGFQQVPLSLATLFARAEGELRLKTRVDGFDWTDGAFDLRLVGSDKPLRAGTVILAMPRRSLDLIAPKSPPLQEIRGLIGSVTPRPLLKIFTTYTSPWWRAAGYTNPAGTFIPLEAGRTVTDLPVRQTYYWPTAEGKPATAGPAMLMASYDDGREIGFWDGLRGRRHIAWQHGEEVAPLDEVFGADQHGDGAWDRHRASTRMVMEVARQLRAIHGLTYTPRVQSAAFRDWGDDPFGGGWNSWNIGVKSWEVKEQIVHPFADRPLYICGEAYSDAQGWVEGALQTADMVLARFKQTAL